MNQLFRITNSSPDTLEIDIEGTIGGGWFEESGATKEKVKEQLKEIAQSRASHIIVNINSYGGDVNHGISIHDMLAEHKAKVTTVIHGHTASAATIISQAGDIRKMSDNALFLIHPASIIAMGNAADIKTALSDLEKVDDTIAGIYAKRCKKDKNEVTEIMNRFEGRGEWLTASEAKELGFVDEIFEPMKAVAMVEPDELTKIGLPAIPSNKIDTMKADKQTVFAWFKEFTDRVTGKKNEAEPETTPEPVPATEPEPAQEETQKLDFEAPEGITVADKQEVVIKDMEEVRTALDDLVNQVMERESRIAEMQDKITALENDLARLNGLPTATFEKQDPFLDKSNLSTNEANHDKNAESLKS